MLTTAWFLAYLVFSVPSGKLIEKVGYKRTMVISLFIMVVGALLFVPAAIDGELPGLPDPPSLCWPRASASCRLSANPYVSILGPESSAPARLNAGAGLQLARLRPGASGGGLLYSHR